MIHMNPPPRSWPIASSANPGATAATMHAAQTAIAALLRSTAFTLVTTAVTVSTRRSTRNGSENAADENTTPENTAPTALPTPKNVR